MKSYIQHSLIIIVAFLFSSFNSFGQEYAQTSIFQLNNPKDPCNNSQPDIEGPTDICPGGIYTYCATGDVNNYTSYEWDVPRAHAGNPPTGWVILSGQGTRCVTVMAGQKSGTMKVKVEHNTCGTKVATLPVKPREDAPEAEITGPDVVCAYEEQQTYSTASMSHKANNGQGQGNKHNTTFTYNWTVPSDWTIDSGQGTNSITVTPGMESGWVVVTVTGNRCGTAYDSLFVTSEDCGIIIPLPVEIMSFEGRNTSTGIALNWKTAMEKNNDRFSIERSSDGRNFESIGEVRGHGNSNDVKEYSFLDKQPVKGMNYYRLKQIDFDGTSELSKVIAVNSNGNGNSGIEATIWPNPVTGNQVTISLQNVPTEVAQAQVRVFDLNGRTIYTEAVATQRGDINLSLQQANMSPGIYIISIQAGAETKQQKVVVK